MSESNICPLCGKRTNVGDSFCPDCQEIAQNAYSDELLTHRQIEEVSLENIEESANELAISNMSESSVSESNADALQHTPQKKKKTFVFFFLGLVVLVMVGAIGSYIFLQNKESEETQMAYWEKCIEENTPLAYSKYLVQYPDGKFVGDAQNKIMELRENEKKDWQTLRNSNNIDALFAFHKDHPQTPYAREINNAIDSLSWLLTNKENSAAAYQAYIENVNLGRFTGNYLDLAQQRYDYLSQLKAVDGDELKEVKKALTDFYHALSRNNKEDVIKLTVPKLVNFYNVADQSNDVIIDSLKKDLKAKKIKHITYIPALTDIEVIRDSKGLYFMSFPVNGEITFIDRKKKKEIFKDSLKVVLNEKRQVMSLHKIKP